VAERNIRITIEYDGTDYFGWQRQPHHVTVQQRVEEAVEAVTQTRTHVNASGRTDTGVHAQGQVANFHTVSAIPAEKFHLALNANLPRDIAVLDAADAPADFHARFDAKSKTYRYTILNQPIRSPLHERCATRIWPQLDVLRMQAAAAHLMGERDFAAFQSEASSGRTSVRTILRAEIVHAHPMIEFWIAANGFVYNMVRAIVGTLIPVGQGKLTPDEFATILDSADRAAAGATAPPQGLCLMRVEY